MNCGGFEMYLYGLYVYEIVLLRCVYILIGGVMKPQLQGGGEPRQHRRGCIAENNYGVQSRSSLGADSACKTLIVFAPLS